MRIAVPFAIFTALLFPVHAKDNWYQAPLPNNIGRIHLEKKDPNDLTSLISTLKDRHPMATVQFLNQGGHLSLWDRDGQTVVELLLENGYRNILERVSATLTPFDELRQITRHPLLRNVYLTHMRFNYLLRPRQLPPFLQHVWVGDMKAFLSLLPEKKLEQKNSLGQTALMLAAARNRVAMLKLMLQLGADPEQRDRFGYTALAYASYLNNQPAINALLEAKASPYAGLSPALSPLFISLVKSNRPLASRFYRVAGTAEAVNQQGELGETLLMYAAVYGSSYHVKQLIRLGADTNAQIERGRTPLFYALKGREFGGIEVNEQFQRIVKLLTDAGAKLNPEQDPT